ncbi:MAG: SPASM domain-containing protein [Candidatus Methanosuratincola sp.]|jgi:radical SAM protein with 4Fe4S-binding SPASM domain|nr:SPASM domain-containing protein [Candidatus Methanosuratincola sp.]
MVPNPIRTGLLRLRKWHEIVPLPKEIVIEPTTKCDLECPTCLHKTITGARGEKDMSFDGFKRILDGIPTLEQVVMSGLGEPLQSPEVLRMCTEAHLRGLRTKLVTNGMMISEENAYDIVFAFDFIELSFNVATIPAIDMLLAEQPSLGTDGRLSVSVLGTPENLRILPAVQSMLARKGVRCVPLPLENWWPEDGTAYQALREMVLQAGGGVVKKRFGKCHWPFSSAFISCDGEVTPCTARMDPSRITFGNAFETPFWAIWDSEPYRSFRRDHLRGGYNRVCQGCPLE